MSDTPTLTQIIQESLSAEDPETDNLGGAEAEDSSEFSVEDLFEGLDEETEEVDEDPEVDDEALSETYQVKVDGEIIDVSLKEALAGYQRQADYTRKAQALAAEREQFEEAVTGFSETIQTLQQLDAAWDENPVQVLAHFTSNTENPTHAVALLIKELATSGLLDQDFMEMFGITSEVRNEWSKSSEVENLRRRVSKIDKVEEQRRQEGEYEAEVQRAVAKYEREIDEILQSEGLSNLTVAQRNAFRSRLASYAHDNELTNLKAAYKALKYEESEKKRALAKKTKERAAQKKTVSGVSRSGSGSNGSAPITDTTDLQSIIRSAMQEATRS